MNNEPAASGVAVIGYGTDELPAFTTTSSGLPVPHCIDDPAEIADFSG